MGSEKEGRGTNGGDRDENVEMGLEDLAERYVVELKN